MSQFKTTIKWKPGTKDAELASEGKPGLTVAPPPEFGGRAGVWTPEDALLGAVQSCLLMTALYFVKQKSIGLKAYESTATGEMKKTPEGLRFQSIEVSICAAVEQEDDIGKIKQAVAQAEKFCPVSAAVSVPINVSVDAKAS